MQRFHTILKAVLAGLVISGLLISAFAHADHLMISRYFSGAWQQPDHESQGMMLHIAEVGEGGKVGVAHWFTFGNDFDTAWFIANGPVVGHEIHMTLFTASGVGFLEADIPGDPMVSEVGTLILSFQNCNQGTATFDTPEDVIGTGTFRIKRLTSLFRSRCSGGITDDTPSDKRPEKLDVRLVSARDDIAGHGKAQFWQRPDRSDFQIEAENVPDRDYDLFVCGEDTGDDLTVLGGEGSLEFRSPPIDAKLHLDFEPRNCQIALYDESGAVLTSGDHVLSPPNRGPRDDHGGLEIKVPLTNTGVLPEGQGEAEFEIKGNKREFEVEIEHLPAGLYPLYVGGVEQGQIEVVENDSKFKGKLKFSDPQTADSELLDFDPRGEIVEILQGDMVILETLFPEE